MTKEINIDLLVELIVLDLQYGTDQMMALLTLPQADVLKFIKEHRLDIQKKITARIGEPTSNPVQEPPE